MVSTDWMTQGTCTSDPNSNPYGVLLAVTNGDCSRQKSGLYFNFTCSGNGQAQQAYFSDPMCQICVQNVTVTLRTCINESYTDCYTSEPDYAKLLQYPNYAYWGGSYDDCRTSSVAVIPANICINSGIRYPSAEVICSGDQISANIYRDTSCMILAQALPVNVTTCKENPLNYFGYHLEN